MIRSLFSFVGTIFSVLTLGLFFVALIVGGILFVYSRDLPNTEQLANYAPPTISRVYSGEGKLMDEFARERRLFVPSEEIPDIVKQAFISAEDKNFYFHQGYDPKGMISAALDAAKGGRVRGASTITQQVMKNFLLGGERSAERKVKELILSARIEESMDKDQILELYLNEIFLGQNSYGVAAAAQTYFNKSLDELEVHEAAYLAVLPKAPSNYHPVRQKQRALERRGYVLREMYENGYLTQAQYEEARDKPLLTVQSGDIEPFRASLPPRNYFTEEIRRQLSADFGEEEFFSGGLSIRATMDPILQDAAQKALQAKLEEFDRERTGIYRGPVETLDAAVLADPAQWREALSNSDYARDIDGWRGAVVLDITGNDARIGIDGMPDTQTLPAAAVTWARPLLENGKAGRKARAVSDLLSPGDVIYVKQVDGAWTLRQIPEIQGGFVAMDVNTGRVLAMQGGFSYQASVFNRATQATRQPGSAFKPFVYAAALDSGYSPATIVIDAPVEIENADGTVWRPKNSSNKFYGPTPLRTGIEQSRNLMTIRLAQEVGMDVVARYAERFGVYDYMDEFLANSLGAQETTVYKMTAAYAMFANGGERVEPTLVDRVQDRWGKTIYRHDARICNDCQDADLEDGKAPKIVTNREQVMDPITAYQLTSMMRGVVDRGTARRYVGDADLGVPIAGKTGTTNDSRDAWFLGFSSNIVAGCYIGYDRPRPMGQGAYGGTLCGPVFADFMKTAVSLYGGGKFKIPPGGNFVKIDRYSGNRLPDDASGDYVVAEYFREGEEPLFGYNLVLDGGFAMGSDLPLFSRGEVDDYTTSGTTVTTSTGETKKIPKKASFGSLSSGGLY